MKSIQLLYCKCETKFFFFLSKREKITHRRNLKRFHDAMTTGQQLQFAYLLRKNIKRKINPIPCRWIWIWPRRFVVFGSQAKTTTTTYGRYAYTGLKHARCGGAGICVCGACASDDDEGPPPNDGHDSAIEKPRTSSFSDWWRWWWCKNNAYLYNIDTVPCKSKSD